MANGDEQPPIQGDNTLNRGDYDRMGAALTETLKQETRRIEDRVDLKVEGVKSEVSAKLDNKPGHGSMIAHTVAIIGILAALLLGVLTLAGDKFNAGLSVTGIMAQQEVERERREADINERMGRIENALIEMRDQNREQQKALANSRSR